MTLSYEGHDMFYILVVLNFFKFSDLWWVKGKKYAFEAYPAYPCSQGENNIFFFNFYILSEKRSPYNLLQYMWFQVLSLRNTTMCDDII